MFLLQIDLRSVFFCYEVSGENLLKGEGSVEFERID